MQFFFNFVLILNQHADKHVSYKISLKSGYEWILSTFSLSSTKIHVKMYHTKFHPNRIIKEAFKILGRGVGDGGPPLWKFSIVFIFLTKLQTKIFVQNYIEIV